MEVHKSLIHNKILTYLILVFKLKLRTKRETLSEVILR